MILQLSRITLVLLALAPIVAVFAQPGMENWRLDKKSLTYPVEGAKRVVVVNPFGDVRIRGSEDVGQIELAGIGQRHADDPRAAAVTSSRTTPDELRIELTFADPDEVDPDPDWSRRRFDASLAIPAGVEIMVQTGGGLVEIKGVERDAEIETTSGDIVFVGKGGLTARSDTGAIRAQFRTTSWQAPAVLETVTGNIRVELLSGAEVRVEVETRGPITTDYSIDIESQPNSGLKQGVAVIGVGERTRTLVVKSVKGEVRLVSMIVPEET